MNENRMYMNTATGLGYFQWHGETRNPMGTVNVQAYSASSAHMNSQHVPCPVGQFPGSFAWNIQITQFIANVVRDMRPTHLIVSAGNWDVSHMNWQALAEAGASAVHDTG